MLRTTNHRTSMALLAALALTNAATMAIAEPMTYQGRLTDASLPANGSYDMIFRVYSAASGGDLLATAPAVTVSALDGLIIATPDFPAGTFTGATVYLDVSVRATGAPLFARIGPRQAITPAPLAMRSLNERWSPRSATSIRTDAGVSSVLINDDTATFGDAVLMVTSSTGPGALGGMYVNTAPGDGVPYYGWSANHLSLAEARVEAATNTFVLRSGVSEWLRITAEGRVGIGVAPIATDRLRVNGNMVALGQVAADDVVASDDVIASDTSSANTFTYSTPKTRSISIPPEAFHPAMTSQVGVFGGGTGMAYLDSAVAAGAITTGLYLPHGATVISIDAYVYDNSAASNLIVDISTRTNTSTGYVTMASVTSSGASASVVTLTTSTITAPTINNDTNNYMVWVFCSDWQGGNLGIKGVRVRYTVPGPD